MKLGQYAAALGSILQEKRLNVIANNLANAQTPGYKRDIVRFTDFLYEETHTQMQPGSLKTTSAPLDLAIIGDGFFKVKTDKGIVYTRSGHFSLDAEGRLVTPEGWFVLGKNGIIKLSSTDVVIDRNGQITEVNQEEGPGAPARIVDTLDIVTFDKPGSVKKVGQNYFMPSDPNAKEIRPKNVFIQQGALEEPNFSIVEEMTNLIDTLRIFEAYQKTLRTFHNEDKQLIRKVSER